MAGAAAESLTKFFDVERLPCSAEVVHGYRGWKAEDALSKGTILTLLYLLRQPAVSLSDDTSHQFTETLTFDKCRFNLLPEDEAFDNKMYLRVEDVMRLQRRPRFVRVLQGYAYDSGRGEEDEALARGQILQVTNKTVGTRNGRLALWYLVSEQTAELVPIRLPFSVEGHFTPTLDDNAYLLSELIGKAYENKLYMSFPFRVRIASGGNLNKDVGDSGVEKKLTVVSLAEEQFLVASDGEQLIRMQANLNVTLKMIPMSDVDLCSAVRLLAEQVNHESIQTVGPPAPASLGAILAANTVRPTLPPRSQVGKAGRGGKGDDNEYSYIYSYVEVGKPRGLTRNRHKRETLHSYTEPEPDLPPPPDDMLVAEKGLSYCDAKYPLEKKKPEYDSPITKQDERYVELKRKEKARPLPVSPKPNKKPVNSPTGGNTPPIAPRERSPSPSVNTHAHRLPQPKLPSHARDGKPTPEVPRSVMPLLSQRSVDASTCPSPDQADVEVKQAKQEVVELRARCLQLENEKIALQKELNRLKSGTPSIAFSNLTSRQVSDMLKDKGLGQYAQAFFTEDVDGSLLPLLDEETLAVSLGVQNRLHRLKILQLAENSKKDEYVTLY